MKKKKDQSKEQQAQELFAALALMEEEKGISVDFMLAQIQKAIITACKNTYGGNDDVTINIDREKNIFEVYLNKVIVDEVTDINKEISLANALKVSPRAEIGGKVKIKLDTMQFARTDVQKVKGIIRQGITDSEKSQALAEYQSRLQENVTAKVEQVDPKNGCATLRLGKGLAKLPKSEQVPGEIITEGEQIKVYVVDVKTDDRGPRAILSRTHPDLVKRLFESEVPEISDGTVLIKSISREAGSRTKIAVYSKDENVDAVGACIGQRGQRVGTIVSELNGEKIDIVEYSEDPVKFITAALSPAEVVKVEIDPEKEKVCKATVPDSQLSLAIGNKGQNVRLAAKLTGWKIDIRPESGFYGEEEDQKDETKYVGDGLDEEDKKPLTKEKDSETEEAAPENTESAEKESAETVSEDNEDSEIQTDETQNESENAEDKITKD